MNQAHQFGDGGVCVLCNRPGMVGDGGYCPKDYFDEVLTVNIDLPGGSQRELNKLWGYSDGLVPLDVTGPSPHRDAAYALGAGWSFRVCVHMRTNKDGSREMRAIHCAGTPCPVLEAP